MNCSTCQAPNSDRMSFCGQCGSPLRPAADPAPNVVVRIGREADNDIRVPEMYRQVSRHHARVGVEGGALWIENISQTNNTTLNGQRFQGRARFRTQDQIKLGSYELNTAELAPFLNGARTPGHHGARPPAHSPAGLAYPGGMPSPAPAPVYGGPPVPAPAQHPPRPAGSRPVSGLAIAGGVLAIITGIYFVIVGVAAVAGGSMTSFRNLRQAATAIGVIALLLGISKIILAAFACAGRPGPAIASGILSSFVVLLLVASIIGLFNIVGVLFLLLELLALIFLFIGAAQLRQRQRPDGTVW